ncbi:uncharacterized protein UTRI_06589 [Ustilago trichophora]|uniref:Uncharacterized protein n=1 Tax=Ustilago trichophora TaxID=86804 RepID=A0A5C3EQC4_9BASI|nr:uncharacterized protein UTRI_06589 [Ustilago trichophora]
MSLEMRVDSKKRNTHFGSVQHRASNGVDGRAHMFHNTTTATLRDIQSQMTLCDRCFLRSSRQWSQFSQRRNNLLEHFYRRSDDELRLGLGGQRGDESGSVTGFQRNPSVGISAKPPAVGFNGLPNAALPNLQKKRQPRDFPRFLARSVQP